MQGFSGGTLIPAVFAAVFLLFPERRQGIATMLAGVLAVSRADRRSDRRRLDHQYVLVALAVSDQHRSGHRIRHVWRRVLLPQNAVAAGARPARWTSCRWALMAIALGALEIALKEAPERGWTSGLVLGLLALAVASGAWFAGRTLRAVHRIVDLGSFADRDFTIGCILSFVLGIGLFGSVYMMPVYLAFVRYHDALEIGTIMLVTGVAQLLTAPIAVVLEQRLDARWLTAFGFALFAVGLGLSALQTPRTDYAQMFWPQIIRGVAIMFCLLPPTRLALGHLEPHRVADASGLFNLMRNLGGAIGLALIDSVIYGRSGLLGQQIVERLRAGDIETAKFIGLSTAGLRGPTGRAADGGDASGAAADDRTRRHDRGDQRGMGDGRSADCRRADLRAVRQGHFTARAARAAIRGAGRADRNVRHLRRKPSGVRSGAR